MYRMAIHIIEKPRSGTEPTAGNATVEPSGCTLGQWSGIP